MKTMRAKEPEVEPSVAPAEEEEDDDEDERRHDDDDGGFTISPRAATAAAAVPLTRFHAGDLALPAPSSSVANGRRRLLRE